MSLWRERVTWGLTGALIGAAIASAAWMFH
jgi:hypothetical protein